MGLLTIPAHRHSSHSVVRMLLKGTMQEFLHLCWEERGGHHWLPLNRASTPSLAEMVLVVQQAGLLGHQMITDSKDLMYEVGHCQARWIEIISSVARASPSIGRSSW